MERRGALRVNCAKPSVLPKLVSLSVKFSNRRTNLKWITSA